MGKIRAVKSKKGLPRGNGFMNESFRFKKNKEINIKKDTTEDCVLPTDDASPFQHIFNSSPAVSEE